MNMIQKAREFAIEAHEGIGQVRRYTGEAYWHHPEGVAATVATVTDDPEMIAAAWLHDVVEDTTVTLADIGAKFGKVVAGYVDDLTDVDDDVEGTRAYRKGLNIAHAATIHPNAMTVKLADIINNVESVVEYAPHFAKVYIPEQRRMVAAMEAGNRNLWLVAMVKIVEAEKALAALA